MEKLIEIKDISAGYDTKPILSHISLDVWEKDFLGIIGPNGGGKTTLLKIILGLMKPSSGKVLFYENGHPTPSVKIGYLPQINPIDKKFPISVYDVVASGLASETPLFGSLTNGQKERIGAHIEKMGLAAYSDRAIGELSGGQLQRVLLARALVSSPKLLILDEPNTYVDKKFESQFYELLGNINQETAIILVSHDIGTILSLVKNIACINETIHYHEGTDITAEWLDRMYSCPIEIVGHGELPHRILKTHENP